MNTAGLTMKFTAVLLVALGIACVHFVPRTVCAPKRGDTAMQVLQVCGKPKYVGAVTTRYGALRQEFEYFDMHLLLEDRIVIHVVKFAPAMERPR